jgi:hypothetical protein
MFADKYRQRHLTDFERASLTKLRNAVVLPHLHRATVLEQREGGAHIDTFCPLCTNKAIEAQCFLCNGACDGNQHCPVLNAEWPAPEVTQQNLQIAKPSRFARWWKRVQDWWIGDEP